MIKPYGSNLLVNRYIEENDFLELDMENTIDIVCDGDDILECERIADGSLTPIDGFMYFDDIDRIIDKNRLKNGVYFPIPIFLQVNENCKFSDNQKVLLKNKQNEIIGFINNARFFKYDLDKLCKFMFGVTDTKHPGVERIKNNGNVFVGGQLSIIKRENSLTKYCKSPVEVREMIEKKKWSSCVGFQTRNVPHLAHEHLQRVALEIYDGLLIHPVVGWKKKNDYLPDVVIGSYEYLVENIYPENKVILSGLQIQMRYAGPKEAIIHAIIRQNYGCTHFIVGRDHAGVGGYYKKYEAQEIFNGISNELEINILKLKGPFFCKKCNEIVTDNTCRHGEDYTAEVSGSLIREMILDGRYPPESYIRKEIVDRIRMYESIFV